MKKKLLALFMAATMSMALIACGGDEKEAAATEAVTEEAATEEAAEETTDVEYSEEQAAFVDEFNTMVDAYNVAVDAFNATPELTEDQELVDVLNEATTAIDEAAEIISDPANLTAEIMDSYRTAFADTYALIDAINEAVGTGDLAGEISGEEALRALFTTALAGADEAENTYWFLFNNDLTMGACVILSADYTQSVNVLGTVSADGDAMVITDDETGDYVKFTVTEEGEDYLVVQFEEGNEVTIINEELDSVIETVLAIDETTEIMN